MNILVLVLENPQMPREVRHYSVFYPDYNCKTERCKFQDIQVLNQVFRLVGKLILHILKSINKYKDKLLPYSQRTVWSRPLSHKSSHPSSPSGEDCRIISHCDQRSSLQSPMPNLRVPFFNEGKLHNSRKIDSLLP
ncbi:Hypothetical_protein [Hexamita inflata]|uniref:Hypothetical_protein n=1 Tax=Hexamita inflata TaxID=28002 RepID=A0ABP1GZU6_9EUKA